jgi:hypothetical protein
MLLYFVRTVHGVEWLRVEFHYQGNICREVVNIAIRRNLNLPCMREALVSTTVPRVSFVGFANGLAALN